MASSYKIGSIAQLIGGGDGEIKKEQNQVDKDDLFTTKKKQKDRPKEDIVASPKKRIKRKSKDNENEDDSHSEEVKPKKKSKQTKSEGEDEEKAPVKYYSAKYEDKKERVSDADADARTIFVGNLRSDTKPMKLRALFKPFGTVESVRLRCAARPDPNTAKRIAVIKRSFHQSRTNINAFVKFSKPEEARSSCKINGSKFNDYVIRVDMATPKHGEGSGQDNRKAIFVGNLDFGIEENALREHFAECGDIVSVRLIRDGKSGMGKGFGYVNFESEDAVELAMGKNGSELKGRAVRIQRCVKKPKMKGMAMTSTAKPNLRGGKKTGGFKRNPMNKKYNEKAPSFQGKATDEVKTRRKVKTKQERKQNRIAKKLQS